MPAEPATGVEVRNWAAAGPGRVRLELTDGVAEVAVARDGAVRLRAERADELSPDPSSAVGREAWREAPAEAFEREEGGPALAFEGAEGFAYVEIDVPRFALRVTDRDGACVAEVHALALQTGGGARVALAAPEGERFFGLAESGGPLDHRGRKLRLRNRDPGIRLDRDPLYLAIPFLLRLGRDANGRGMRATGLLLDAFGPSRFDVAATHPDRLGVETELGALDLTFFPGPRPRDVVRRFGARVGRTPRPPLWALGHHQSRWSYASAAAVRALAREIRRRRIPTDAIHLDIDHMRGYRVFTWDPRRFPAPKGLLAELADTGFRTVTVVDPGVKADPKWRVFRDGVERDVFCRRSDGRPFTFKVWPQDAALPDFTRPETRAWWGEQHRPLVEVGVAGIWNDMNEPAGWSREIRLGRLVLPLRGQDLSDVVQADPARPENRVPHEHVRNLYGHLQCRATFEGLARLAPGRRPFVLSRSGFAGVQRWAAVWTGDSWSTWRDLRRSMRMLLGLSLCGVAFCGADIGGFAFPCTRELYARWIEIGALYPFARTHSMWGKPRQEPWRFGRRVEAIARAALELRMRLLPYLYALFCEAEARGDPVWRPLFYEFPDDETSATIDDQVMIGPSLLAAPVLDRGARERDVLLPPGAWFSWHDDARFVGPRRVRVPAPLGRLPLFVRAGTVLTTQSAVSHVGERPEEPLVLEVYPGADAAAVLVEDDGESTAYRHGAEARTALRLRDRAGGRLRLEIGRRVGRFTPAPRQLRVAVHGCPPPHAVRLDAQPLPERTPLPGWRWEDGTLQIRFEDDGGARVVEIEPAP